MLNVPRGLDIVNAPADYEEVGRAEAIRKEYYFDLAPNPYMADVSRAFRLAQGAKIYVEVGTQDKGNIAWLARTRLAPGATVIDIDFQTYPEHDARIRDEMTSRGFDYHALRGDCLSDEILGQVRAILDGRSADLIFCDSHYTYEHTMTEFSCYFPLVKEGGFLLFHDSVWSGDSSSEWEEVRKRGKGYAIADLDRYYPAYLVQGDTNPVRRFSMPPLDVTFWATVTIFPKD
jgi:cephalosporin hydroxylase